MTDTFLCRRFKYFMGKPFNPNPIDLNFLDDIFGLRLMLRFCIFITLICSASTSMALGLSDIALKSNLGEPFDASVMIEDAESALDVTCFVVKEMSGESALKRINTRLVERNQQYQLLISTSVTVTEPIVNLTVSYACEPHIARSYVLLLDPAPLPVTLTPLKDNPKDNPSVDSSNTPNSKTVINSKPVAKPAENNTQNNSNVVTSDANNPVNNNGLDGGSPAAVNKPAKKVSKKPRKPKTNPSNQVQNNSAQNTDAKLMEAYVGKPANASPTNNAPKSTTENTAPASNPNATRSKPYLVISGGALNGGAPYDASQTGLTLQLETQIDFNRAVEPPALPTNEETLDEVTVMANRLAHLEKQILLLQSTNLQLKAKVVEAENTGFKLSETQKHWLHYAGIILGILLLIGIIEFARRQFLRHRLKRDEAIWFIGDTSGADARNDLNADLDELEQFTVRSPNGDSFFNQSASLPTQQVEPIIFNSGGSTNLAAPASTNTQSATEQEVESVLDHADVFIAHGRANLAIQLLQNHLEELPTESPAVWLKLLGLLASENSESDYEMAVVECNQFFNIKLPSYAEALNEDESSIENHPHIVSRLEGVWGSQYAIGFLNDLIYNQQSQPREGFARNTFEELFFLRQISEILQNNLMPEGTTNVYRAESVQPALEKVAVNAAVFGNVTPINSASNHVVNVQNEDALFDQSNDAVESAQTLKPSAIMTQEAELNIASFAAQDFNDEFNDAFKDDELESDTLPKIVFVSEAEQSLVENMHETITEHSAFDDAITEEIDFSNTGSETTQGSITTHELDTKDHDANTLAFDESAFKEISDAVKANMLEKSAEELAEADNSNMIEFDWNSPDTAETPRKPVKTSKNSTKK